MKKSNILLAAILGYALAMPALAAPTPDADPDKQELTAVLKQHDEALNKQDIKALISFYTDDPNVALMGTGPGEFWKGKAAVEDAYAHFFKDFKAGSLAHECTEGAGGRAGDVAWLVVACNMKDTAPEGQAREYALNVSAVLKKETAGWKFQTMHFSNLTDSDAPPPATAPAPGANAATPSQPK